MNDLKIGTVQSLLVDQRIENGYVLKYGEVEVLLAEEEVTESIETSDEVRVFLYQDRNKNLAASMKIPEAKLDTYGWAEVVEVVNNLGVFVNIGVEKEILVSLDDLPLIDRVWPIEGDWLFVSLELDKKGRLFAKPITEEDVQEDMEKAPADSLHHTVTGRVYRATKAGSFIMTEEGYRGFIHPRERKEEPRLGQTVEGRIIGVKEDGTINVSLLPLKREGMEEDAETILTYLEQHNGVMPFHDKSDPEDIRQEFSISKAAFKRAIGKLLKENKVIQENGTTYLKSIEEE